MLIKVVVGAAEIAFPLGAHDAALIAREFEPVFNRRDLLMLSNHDIYLKLMIDGTPSELVRRRSSRLGDRPSRPNSWLRLG